MGAAKDQARNEVPHNKEATDKRFCAKERNDDDVCELRSTYGKDILSRIKVLGYQ
jgi:hypothetical protein